MPGISKRFTALPRRHKTRAASHPLLTMQVAQSVLCKNPKSTRIDAKRRTHLLLSARVQGQIDPMRGHYLSIA